MCDQTEVQYLPGEVVWVKLRALWWPGLVQDYDALPEEITCSLRKRPIATVKFFQEDSYEYVHKLDLIYHYNCSRKREFIKKGLDLCRKKTADRPATMDFFPADIVTAEEMTGGDPNILQDEAFKPEEKPKYTSLFGSEKKKFGKGKKGKEDSPLKDKVARRKKLTSKLEAMGWLSSGVTANIIYPSPDTPRIVTHRRFLNKLRNPDAKSDYDSRIRLQSSDEELSNLSEKIYQCVMCGYATSRLNVIVLHFNSIHSRKSKNIFQTPSILKGGSLRNPLLVHRKSESGRSSLVGRKRSSLKVKTEKVARVVSDGELSDQQTPKPLPVKKEKGKRGRKRKVRLEEKSQEDEEPMKKPKILDSLLADWDEHENQEEENDSQDKSDREEEDDNSSNENETNVADQSLIGEESSMSKSKEVFEFDPEDEDDNMNLDLPPSVKGFGRRIPRVIETTKDKKHGSSGSKKIVKGKATKKEKEAAADNLKEKSNEEDKEVVKESNVKMNKKEKDSIVDDFESLLAETSVPSLPSIPKSSNFSLDIEDEPRSEESHVKGKGEVEKGKRNIEKSQRSKNSHPEVDLAVDPNNPPQGLDAKNTAKVTVEKLPDMVVVSSDMSEERVFPCLDASPNDGKGGASGDHTYVSGHSGRKRRRSLLPLERNEDNLDIMSMPVVIDDNVVVEGTPRSNKQPFLPQMEGTTVVNQRMPKRLGRPPKRGRGGRGSKSMRSPPPQQAMVSPPGQKTSKSPSSHLSKSPPPQRNSKSPSPHHSSLSPPPFSGPKSPPQSCPKSPSPIRSPPHASPKSPSPIRSPPHASLKSPSPIRSPPRASLKSPSPIRSPPRASLKSPTPIKSPPGPKSPSPIKSPPHPGPKSPSPMKSPPHPSSKSPSSMKSPKSPPADQTLRSPEQSPKSPSHQQSMKSSPLQQSPRIQQVQQGPKSPVQIPLSPGGPKSPPGLQNPKSSPPYQSPSHQGPKSPQGLQSPKSPVVTSAKLTSPKGPSSLDIKTLKSPPQSPVKTIFGDAQSSSVLSGPLPSQVAQPLPGNSPVKNSSNKIPAPGSPVSKTSAGSKKVNTSGAVVVQSKPDLQPEACGIGKILSIPASVASSSSGSSIKTIKLAVSSSSSSPVTLSKPGTPGSQPRKVMIVQGKGGQKMLLPTEASQQLLSNIGSGKKIMVITKSSGSPGKLVLTSQHQKIVGTDGKAAAAQGQIVTSKGTVVSSVGKLVSSKPSTSVGSSPAPAGAELSSEPPALVKTDGKKTYKIITSPQSKGNIFLNTSSGQIFLPVSSISGATGTKQIILPAGSKNMKVLNAVSSTGQKVIFQMKSTPSKAGLTSSTKTVQSIVPKTVQSISPKGVQPISPKVVQTLTPKTVQQIVSKTVQPISPKTGQPIIPKASPPIKATKVATVMQPVPQLTPIGAPKTPRPKQIVEKTVPAKSPRKTAASVKPSASATVTTSTVASTVVLPSASPQKKTSGTLMNPSLKTIVPQSKASKKISLTTKPVQVESVASVPVSSPPVSSAPETVQVVSGSVPGLETIQTSIVPSVETSGTLTLPSSNQQLVAVPTEDGGQVMYLIDNNSLIGLDGSNQANLQNIILAFDNMGQPVSSGTSEFTFTAPTSGQDILAEALANTQVLQPEAPVGELSLDASGLLSSHSNSNIYPPTLSHGVLETSLTLNQPIMTPLEDLSAVSTLQPPPASGAITSVDLPSTITMPDITISTSSYASLPIPSATVQSTVFSEAQNITTFSTTVADDGSVFMEAPVAEGESFLTSDHVYEQSSEGASMPLLDG